MNATDILELAPTEWPAAVEALNTENRQTLESELAGLTQRAALLHDYVAHRFNTGCGDQGHEASAEHANRRLKAIRSAMGYALPHAAPVRIP